MAKKKSDDAEMIEEDFMGNDIFVPEIPLPDDDARERDVIEDECDAAFKFCFCGTGQAGARLAESFWKLGYRRVCAINTNAQDLAAIQIPEENKLIMEIGEGGAGKDPSKGERAITGHYEDVYDLMRRSFGRDFDRILVMAGAGGGTGSGSITKLIDIAHDIAQSFKIEEEGKEPVVGALVSLPQNGEGKRVNANALGVLDMLFERVGENKGRLAGRSLSPLILVDNDRISKLYPNLSVSQFWSVANQSISSLFHLFNSIATKDSDITTFDRADMQDVLQGGLLTFGATPLSRWDSPTDISYAIRDNLKRNILVADLDLSTAETAACIVVGHPDVFNEVPQDHLNHGFEMLSRIMKGEKGIVHRGVYKGAVKDSKGKPSMVIYTLIGELGKPEERLEEITRLAGGGSGNQQKKGRLGR